MSNRLWKCPDTLQTFMHKTLLQGWKFRTVEEELLNDQIQANHDSVPVGWKKLPLDHAEEENMVKTIGDRLDDEGVASIRRTLIEDGSPNKRIPQGRIQNCIVEFLQDGKVQLLLNVEKDAMKYE